MSLQVWLPLTKDLRNQGLNGIPVTSTGTIDLNDNGKLGTCYKTSNTGIIDLKYAGTQINTGSISLCGWFKFNKSELVATWSSYSFDSSHPYPTGNLIGNNSYGGVGLIWYTNSLASGAAFTSLYAACSIRSTTNGARITNVVTIPFDTWVHLALVFNKTTKVLELWMNGELKVTGTMLDFDDAKSDNLKLNYGAVWGGNGPGYSIPFLINDVRIYDHCLSEMEIKQLSQGLVLHYLLNRNGWGQDNLMPNSIEMPVGSANPSTGTWRLAGSSQMTRSRVAISDAPISNSAYGLQSVGLQTGPDGSCWGIDGFPRQNNTVYTISAYARIVGGSDTAAMAGFSIYSSSTLDYGGTYGKAKSSDAEYYGSGAYDYAGGKLNPNGNWTRIYRTFMSTSTSDNFYVGFNTAKTGNSVTVQLCGVKLEIGDKITPWIPNSNESMYTTLGLDGTTEYDCSGYCNNGTRTGTFGWTSDTPKYMVSTQFNGTNNAIQTPDLTTLITDKNYTIACWFYKTAIGTKSYQTIYGGPSGFELEARNGSNTDPQLVAWNWGKPVAAYEFNKWNHFVFVHSDSDCKIYLNGEYISTGTAKASNPSGNYFVGAWNASTSQNYEGLMSDFRIYATALSAADVKSLYQNCATIDADGTIHGQIRS